MYNVADSVSWNGYRIIYLGVYSLVSIINVDPTFYNRKKDVYECDL